MYIVAPKSGLAINGMRVSVPNIPEAILKSANAAQTRAILPAEAVDRIASFLSPGNAAVVTGAGVSVDSGIRAYRGSKGRYLNPNYKYVSNLCCSTSDCLTVTVPRPIFVRQGLISAWYMRSKDAVTQYHELMDPSTKGAAYRYAPVPVEYQMRKFTHVLLRRRYWCVPSSASWSLPLRVLTRLYMYQATVIPRLPAGAGCATEHDALRSRCPAALLCSPKDRDAERRRPAPQSYIPCMERGSYAGADFGATWAAEGKPATP